MASRLTKYLKQKAIFASVLTDEQGKVVLNDYGEPDYSATTLVRCRKQPYERVESSYSGQYVDIRSVYYFDDSVIPKVGDMVDGAVVKKAEEYIDGMGLRVGFEVYV